MDVSDKGFRQLLSWLVATTSTEVYSIMTEEENLVKQINFLTDLINKAKLKNENRAAHANQEVSSINRFNPYHAKDFSWKRTEKFHNTQPPSMNVKTRVITSRFKDSTKPCMRPLIAHHVLSRSVVLKDDHSQKVLVRSADSTVRCCGNENTISASHDQGQRQFSYSTECNFDVRKEQVIQARKQMKRNIDSLKIKIEELRAAKKSKKENNASIESHKQESQEKSLDHSGKVDISSAKGQVTLEDTETNSTKYEMFAVADPTPVNTQHELSKSADCLKTRTDISHSPKKLSSQESSSLESYSNLYERGLVCNKMQDSDYKQQSMCNATKDARITNKKAKIKQHTLIKKSEVEKLREDLNATEEKLQYMRKKIGFMLNEPPLKVGAALVMCNNAGKSSFIKAASDSAKTIDGINIDGLGTHVIETSSDVLPVPESSKPFSGRTPKAVSGSQDTNVIGFSLSTKHCLKKASKLPHVQKNSVSNNNEFDTTPCIVASNIQSSNNSQFRYVKIPKQNRGKLPSKVPHPKSSQPAHCLPKRQYLKKVNTDVLQNQAGKTTVSMHTDNSPICVRTQFKLVKNSSLSGIFSAHASQPFRKSTQHYTNNKHVRQVLESATQHPSSSYFLAKAQSSFGYGRSFYQKKWDILKRRGSYRSGLLKHFSTTFCVPQYGYRTRPATFMGSKTDKLQGYRYQWKRRSQDTCSRSYRSINYMKLQQQQQQMRNRINLMMKNRDGFSRGRINRSPSKLQTGRGRHEQLLMINGILYKSSTTHLMKASTPVSSKRRFTHTASNKSVVVKSMNKTKMQAVTVRGVRFNVDLSGKRLRRDFSSTYQEKSASVSRVDIGGTTYVETRQGILERMYDHQTRTVVNRVKQRCIALATAKFRKNNTKDQKKLCLFFCRFGKCGRGDKCPYVHDPDKIAVCTRFLRGTCKIEKCPYSHKVAKEKMPVCAFFLRGVCTREDCPYLHVKVNKGAELCEDFITGFCSLAEKCPKLHSLICPAFAKTGKCEAGKKCHLIHRRAKTSRQKNTSTERHLNSGTRPAMKQFSRSAAKEQTVEEGQNEVSQCKIMQFPGFISLADYSPKELLAQTSSHGTRCSECPQTSSSCGLHIKPRL